MVCNRDRKLPAAISVRSNSIPPRKSTIKRVKVEIKGRKGRKSLSEKSFRTGPSSMPIKIRNRISGQPVLLNRIFAKKPMIIIAAAIKKTSTVSISGISSMP
jgi:hypothetical protein